MASPPPSIIPSVAEYDTTQPQSRPLTQSTNVDPSFFHSSEPYGWPSSASRRSHVSKVSWNWMSPPDGRSSVGLSNPNYNHNQTSGNGRRPLPQPTHPGRGGYPNRSGYNNNPNYQSSAQGNAEAPPFAPQYRQPPAPSDVGLGSSQSGDPQESYAPGQEEEYGDEGEMEDMSVGPVDVDLEQGGGSTQGGGRRRGRAMTFVGGFVTGLKRLPGMVTRTAAAGASGGGGGWGLGGQTGGGRTQEKKFETGKPTYGLPEEQGTTSTLPRYEDPGQPISGPSNVTYVQGMNMPTEEVASMSYVDGDYGFSYTREQPLDNPYDHHRSQSHVSHLSRSHRSQSQSHQSRSYSRSHAPTAHTIDSRSQSPSQSFSRSPRSTSSAHARVLGSPFVESPIQVTPLPTSDYKNMDVPPHFEPPDDSFSAHINRLQNFFHELRELPWMSSRIAVDYYPERSSRSRLAQKLRVDGSWYSQREMRSIDLLEPASVTPFTGGMDYQPRAPPPAMSTAQNGGGRRELPAGYATHRTRPTPAPQNTRYASSSPLAQRATTTRVGGPPLMHTPTSHTMGLMTSPGLPSHGVGPAGGSPQSMQQYGYYLANPPQPLWVVPSPYSSPRSPTVPGFAGAGVGADAGPPPFTMPMPMPGAEGTPGPTALPLYVVTAPSPVVTPKSPGPIHKGALGKEEPGAAGAGAAGIPNTNSSTNANKVEGQA